MKAIIFITIKKEECIQQNNKIFFFGKNSSMK